MRTFSRGLFSRLLRNRPLMLILFLSTCFFTPAFLNMSASALHTASWVDNHVQWVNNSDGTAKPRVVGWENDCTDTFNQNVATMPHSNDAQRREVVNASAYLGSVWLSRNGDPR